MGVLTALGSMGGLTHRLIASRSQMVINVPSCARRCDSKGDHLVE